MLTAGVSRTLVILCGYVWPAYLCFKQVKHGKPDALQPWCKYWLVLALFTGLEYLADYFLFWVPLYYEAKFLFVLFLWHPRTKGAAYLYDTMLCPLLTEYEPTIDHNMAELKSWVGSHITNHISSIRNLVQDKAMAAVDSLRQYQHAAAAGVGPQPPAGSASFKAAAGKVQ